jgi:SAM-dependent methyltransferase
MSIAINDALRFLNSLDAEIWAGGSAALLQWAGEFAKVAFEPNPFTVYHKHHQNEIEGCGFKGGNITARSLLLGRYLTTSDVVYGPDNYIACLGLSGPYLHSLAKKNVLDVGCGYAIFPAEAKVCYNIEVYGTDLYAKQDAMIQKAAFCQYAKNHLFAEYVRQQRGGLEPEGCKHQDVLRKLIASNLPVIHGRYIGGEIENCDCTNLTSRQKDQFDAVFCSWLFMYLSHEEAVLTLKEMVRVTRPGGQIRICPGVQMHMPQDQDQNMGLPPTLTGIKGLKEIAVKEEYKNVGKLRVFAVSK